MRPFLRSFARLACIALYSFSLLWMLEACPATKPPSEPGESAQETTSQEATKEAAKEAAKEPAVADKRGDAGSTDIPSGQDASAGDKGNAKPPHPLTNKVEKSRYEKDLAFIAKVRAPGSEHWKKVQDLCAARFKEYGFKVELHKFGVGLSAGVNVIGVKEGTKAPKEQILISAHYDSTPKCEGADDNAGAQPREPRSDFDRGVLGSRRDRAPWL